MEEDLEITPFGKVDYAAIRNAFLDEVAKESYQQRMARFVARGAFRRVPATKEEVVQEERKPFLAVTGTALQVHGGSKKKEVHRERNSKATVP